MTPSVPLGKPGKQQADALTPAAVPDRVSSPSDLERLGIKTAEDKEKEQTRLRQAIRRVMARGGVSTGAQLFCVWCGKNFDYDADGVAMHAEPIEDCPGPPVEKAPTFEEIQERERRRAIEIQPPERPRRPDFGLDD